MLEQIRGNSKRGKMSVQPAVGSKPNQVLLSVPRNQVSTQWGEGGGRTRAHLHRRLRTARERSRASRGLWGVKTNQPHWLQQTLLMSESPRRFTRGGGGSRLKEA